MKKIIIISIILLFSSFPVYGDDSTFCNDPKTWEYFESMTKKYPDDVPPSNYPCFKNWIVCED